MKKHLVPPHVKDEELARILKTIFSELNDLWEKMPEGQTTTPKDTQGVAGNITVVEQDGKTTLQARGKAGWFEVTLTPTQR